MGDRVPVFLSTRRLLWRLLELGEKLRVENVDLIIKGLGNHIILKEAQVEENQNVIEVDARFEKLEVLLCDLDGPVEITVDKLANHVVFFDIF